ncbi:U2 snRNP complex subunit [Entomophthora muscae]|uniref:U2 snRNP complex subunit n=2 Tax=Entomophthora muscae TaxID=34485 RepID=A0ACC2SNC7_9FUNG|nr:U2 snRNP complex subunit [Entomophthora muscae]KAJ9089182.1 U2 snRNP complex subunit [Entomophthora muscae]
MRLTPDTIHDSPCHLNPLGDRELDLRGLKVPEIENLGVTKDLNDTIDLSDNDLRHLHNFPLLRRLKSLLLSNNRISSLDSSLGQQLPNLTTLVLTNNSIEGLESLEPLASLKKLTHLSLFNNPVTKNQNYRMWCIFRFPSVRFLDFTHVKDKERKAAKLLFVAPDGSQTALAASIASVVPAKTFDAGSGLATKAAPVAPTQALQSMSIEDQQRIRASLANAASLV